MVINFTHQKNHVIFTHDREALNNFLRSQNVKPAGTARIHDNMISRRLFVTVILTFFLCDLTKFTQASCTGCLELDEITFDKILANFDYSLVKFDIAFPYGPKHEVFGEFAKNYAANLPNFVVGLVGVKDYGEKENRNLAMRYAIDEKSYPEIILFLDRDNQKLIRYPKSLDITTDNLKRFVAKHTKIYIPLDGCIEQFDKLAKAFMEKSGTDDQKKIIEEANQSLKALEDTDEVKNRAQIYIRLMEKIVERGGNDAFVNDERKRVEKLLREKISDKKKKQLVHKQNILQSFQISSDNSSDQKDEL